MKQTVTQRKSLILVESAVMIALATVLSLFPLMDLPYGGSITIASMLPIMIIGYRHGLLWGCSSGLVYGVIQQLLGLKNLSYFTTWQSIVAIILLDYLIAYTFCGLSGMTRRLPFSQAKKLAVGALFSCVLRYLSHVVSGATVWAGLSIPTQAALGYSLVYNATYMIPEAIVTAAVAFYLGTVLDFQAPIPTRIRTSEQSRGTSGRKMAAGLILCLAGIFDIVSLAAHLQDPETGSFTVTQLNHVRWLDLVLVSVGAVIVAFVLHCIDKRKSNKQS